MCTKKKDWVTNLALVAETAISCLPDSACECYRWQVAKRHESLYNENKQLCDHKDKPETKIRKTLKVKLDDDDDNINNNNNNNVSMGTGEVVPL